MAAYVLSTEICNNTYKVIYAYDNGKYDGTSFAIYYKKQENETVKDFIHRARKNLRFMMWLTKEL